MEKQQSTLPIRSPRVSETAAPSSLNTQPRWSTIQSPTEEDESPPLEADIQVPSSQRSSTSAPAANNGNPESSTTPPQQPGSRPRTGTRRFHVRSYDEEAFRPFVLGGGEDENGGPLPVPRSRPGTGGKRRPGSGSGLGSRPTSGRVRKDAGEGARREINGGSGEQLYPHSQEQPQFLNNIIEHDHSLQQFHQRENNAPFRTSSRNILPNAPNNRSLITLVGKTESRGDVPTAAALARAAGAEEDHVPRQPQQHYVAPMDSTINKPKPRKIIEPSTTAPTNTLPPTKPHPTTTSHITTTTTTQPPQHSPTKRPPQPPSPHRTSPHPSTSPPSSTTLSNLAPRTNRSHYAPPGAGDATPYARSRRTTFGKSNRIEFIRRFEDGGEGGRGLGLTRVGGAGEERILGVPSVFGCGRKGGGGGEGWSGREWSAASPLPAAPKKAPSTNYLSLDPEAPRTFREFLIFEKPVRDAYRR
ncbi:hypothetical protein HDV00_003932 [Rhizophlyctis rosea]|nr:hypothetical protein HDV00_003932 [Rhizophlyctis rosea]